jgi:hypothetical protein
MKDKNASRTNLFRRVQDRRNRIGLVEQKVTPYNSVEVPPSVEVKEVTANGLNLCAALLVTGSRTSLVNDHTVAINPSHATRWSNQSCGK